MQALNVTTLPIYLPFDKAALPFGDPIEGVTAPVASPGIVTAPGYVPQAGDAVAFSYTAGGNLPTGLTVGTTYYVVSPTADTFEVSATKGGAAINFTVAAATNMVLHLLSAQVDGVTLPFKPGNTVVVANLSGGSLTLQGASDVNSTYGVPGGPGAFNTIVTVAAGSVAIASLQYDWIKATGTLVLLQN